MILGEEISTKNWFAVIKGWFFLPKPHFVKNPIKTSFIFDINHFPKTGALLQKINTKQRRTYKQTYKQEQEQQQQQQQQQQNTQSTKQLTTMLPGGRIVVKTLAGLIPNLFFYLTIHSHVLLRKIINYYRNIHRDPKKMHPFCLGLYFRS